MNDVVIGREQIRKALEYSNQIISERECAIKLLRLCVTQLSPKLKQHKETIELVTRFLISANETKAPLP